MNWEGRLEGTIDIVNIWFGSVEGILEQIAFIVVWIATQFTKWHFDPWPFIGLMMVLTIASYLTNAMLMNKQIRQGIITDAILANMVSLLEENREQNRFLKGIAEENKKVAEENRQIAQDNKRLTESLAKAMSRIEHEVQEIGDELDESSKGGGS